eukprot:352986-Chlamydomonas_euryale.AAC.19
MAAYRWCIKSCQRKLLEHHTHALRPCTPLRSTSVSAQRRSIAADATRMQHLPRRVPQGCPCKGYPIMPPDCAKSCIKIAPHKLTSQVLLRVHFLANGFWRKIFDNGLASGPGEELERLNKHVAVWHADSSLYNVGILKAQFKCMESAPPFWTEILQCLHASWMLQVTKTLPGRAAGAGRLELDS